MILKYLEMRCESNAYEKDKDITMLVCSLGFEYKYLNINKDIQMPTRILWMRLMEDWEEGREGKDWKEREDRSEEEKSIV